MTQILIHFLLLLVLYRIMTSLLASLKENGNGQSWSLRDQHIRLIRCTSRGSERVSEIKGIQGNPFPQVGPEQKRPSADLRLVDAPAGSAVGWGRFAQGSSQKPLALVPLLMEADRIRAVKRRFGFERAKFDLGLPILGAKIAFLNGERKGQENLKNDLVRRIKMLEYALKQERAKYHKLKYGTDLIQPDMNPPMEEGVEEIRVDTDSILSTNTNVSWKQSRQLLRQWAAQWAAQNFCC
ncbi:unnamed protein product, partial [Meganyctiphanes norvegica]